MIVTGSKERLNRAVFELGTCVTRDQARRLINKFGNNRAKLSEAARILKARFPAPREAAL
jgi:hypothetical protein